MFNMTGRVAAITGSSRGIGRAIAQALAGQGASVVVNYARDESGAQQVVEEITAAGGSAVACRGDVCVAEDAKGLIDTAMATYGRLDILVNNAGVTRDGLLLRMSEEDWDLVIDTNLKGAFHCMKAAAKVMMKQRYGRIISISSVAGISGNAGQANYASAKAGLIGLSRAVARELGSRNITVNVVAPGLIQTEMTAHLPAGFLEAGVERTLAGRIGQPIDIAAAVTFLASDEASFVTGQVLAVDGGLVL
jgi:3-oxoacyl-[acyl-carrier protein] reductase